MPLAVRQLKVLLIEITQGEIEADQVIAYSLLEEYFPN